MDRVLTIGQDGVQGSNQSHARLFQETSHRSDWISFLVRLFQLVADGRTNRHRSRLFIFVIVRLEGKLFKNL